MSFCRKGTRNRAYPNSLPALTVSSRADAQTLQVTLCKLQYDNTRWVLNLPLRPQSIEDFHERVIPLLRYWHLKLSQRKKGT